MSAGVRRAALSLAALGGSYVALRQEPLVEWDRQASAALAVPRGRAADVAVAAATDLGSVFAITGLAGVLAVSGRRRAALDVAGAGAVAWAVAQGVKPLVERPRPYEAEDRHRLVSEPAGSSWPSGHVAVAAAMTSALTPHLSRSARAVAVGTAAFVGFSRVYVGVHYVTDVAAGLAFGAISGQAWAGLRRRFARPGA